MKTAEEMETLVMSIIDKGGSYMDLFMAGKKQAMEEYASQSSQSVPTVTDEGSYTNGYFSEDGFLGTEYQSVPPTPVTDKYPVMIKCPACDTVQAAFVENTIPFGTFIHHCEKCKYVIMESEWNEIKPFILQPSTPVTDKPFTEDSIRDIMDNSDDGNSFSLRHMTEAVNEKAIEWAANKDKEFLIKLRDIIVRYRKQTGETGVGNHIQNEINEYLATK